MCTVTGLCQIRWLHWHRWGLLILWRTERTNDRGRYFWLLKWIHNVRGLPVGKLCGPLHGRCGCNDRLITVARVRELAPLATFTHCFLHREALASKKLHPELNDVLQTAIKIVNAIKAGTLSSLLFTSLCTEMGSEHQHLLLHAEVRWLPRGKVLTRLLELREEVFF